MLSRQTVTNNKTSPRGLGSHHHSPYTLVSSPCTHNRMWSTWGTLRDTLFEDRMTSCVYNEGSLATSRFEQFEVGLNGIVQNRYTFCMTLVMPTNHTRPPSLVGWIGPPGCGCVLFASPGMRFHNTMPTSILKIPQAIPKNCTRRCINRPLHLHPSLLLHAWVCV